MNKFQALMGFIAILIGGASLTPLFGWIWFNADASADRIGAGLLAGFVLIPIGLGMALHALED